MEKHVANYHHKRHSGFSLIEMVVVIVIIAILIVAIFAGGANVVTKSQISKTISDLHVYSTAAEATLNEYPNVAAVSWRFNHEGIDNVSVLKALNKNLPYDFQFDTNYITLNIDDHNIGMRAGMTDGNTYTVFKSNKTDAWGNRYYAIMDFGERHGTGMSDYYITIVSAGPDAITKIGHYISCDDIFALAQYTNGKVSVRTYNVATDTITTTYLAKNKSDPPSENCQDYILLEHRFNTLATDLGIHGDDKWSFETGKRATTINGKVGYLNYSSGNTNKYYGYTGNLLPVIF